MPVKRSTDNRLIISISLLFAFCGICAVFEISPLLGCMSMGTIYVNLTEDSKLFRQLNYFSPPILLLFFVRSGLNFRLDLLLKPSGSVGSIHLLTVGMLYFFIRIIGKYAGAFLGCLFCKETGKGQNLSRARPYSSGRCSNRSCGNRSKNDRRRDGNGAPDDNTCIKCTV